MISTSDNFSTKLLVKRPVVCTQSWRKANSPESYNERVRCKVRPRYALHPLDHLLIDSLRIHTAASQDDETEPGSTDNLRFIFWHLSRGWVEYWVRLGVHSAIIKTGTSVNLELFTSSTLAPFHITRQSKQWGFLFVSETRPVPAVLSLYRKLCY